MKLKKKIKNLNIRKLKPGEYSCPCVKSKPSYFGYNVHNSHFNNDSFGTYLCGLFFWQNNHKCPLCNGTKAINYIVPKTVFKSNNFNFDDEYLIRRLRIKHPDSYLSYINSFGFAVLYAPLSPKAPIWPIELLKKHNLIRKESYKYWNMDKLI